MSTTERTGLELQGLDGALSSTIEHVCIDSKGMVVVYINVNDRIEFVE